MDLLRLSPVSPAESDRVSSTAGWRRLAESLLASLRYVFTVESHAYAFAIAANALLSFFPFMVLMLSLTENVLHWPAASNVVLVGLRDVLPEDPGLFDFVERNLRYAVRTRGRTEALSLVLLLFASNGIFVPLEVALNRLWGFAKDRSYWVNQVLSLAFALAGGLLALSTTVLASFVAEAAAWMWRGLPWAVDLVTLAAVKTAALPSTFAILLLVYWLLPNGRLSLRRVLPAAAVTAAVLELARLTYRLVWPLLDFRQAYGPFFISITLLLWAYVAAMIVLAGAELSTRWQPLRERDSSS
jgi:YihY family inner membrane protein